MTHGEANPFNFSLHSISGMCIYLLVFVDDIIIVKYIFNIWA